MIVFDINKNNNLILLYKNNIVYIKEDNILYKVIFKNDNYYQCIKIK